MLDLPRTETLELQRDPEWLTIRFDRPDTRNALSQEMVEELLLLLKTVRNDRSLRGITFRGNNGVFCSGGDLKGFMQTMKSDNARRDIVEASRTGGELFAAIDTLPQAVLMLVEGAAIAGGLGMVCAGDAVFVTEDARFALTETMIGIPPAQIAPYVARRLGLRTARRIMLTAARFDGREAVEIGLADRAVAKADAFADLEADFRKAVLRCAPGANATTKELLLAATRLDGEEMIGLAAERFADCLLGEEAKEGISSFLEKRKPNWAEQALMVEGAGPALQKIDRLLVANRGEIALRVMRTAKAMGIKTVAVYADPDARAPFVEYASSSVALSGTTAAETYLDIDKIIQAAKRTGAQAIHPGYGFLSENPAFAKACRQAALVFIGPGEHAIEVMGNKAAAKALMSDIGVACIPGYQGDDQADDAFETTAGEIGYPVMIKAAAGGGGRGMRLVRDAGSLHGELALARSEARNAFGSDELILEKAVENARHVEIQILADSHGNCIHLGERDCSVQRRHQKIVEEAPCPVMTENLRSRMGAAAVKAARSVDYVGAGTVEFLLDGNGDFYFLEMNTRLQVEHPVTEAVTGLDLVGWQIRIARGEALELSQDDVRIDGHAIEVRLCAEDANFMPSTGVIHGWRMSGRPGCRVDTGIAEGFEISPYYDSMIAKVICHGPDRESARLGLLASLDETILLGPETNKPFLKKILSDSRFVEGDATTSLVDQLGRLSTQEEQDSLAVAIAALLDYLDRCKEALRQAAIVSDTLLGWSSSPLPPAKIRLARNGTVIETAMSQKGRRCFEIATQEHGHQLRVDGDGFSPRRIGIDGQTFDIPCSFVDRADIYFSFDGEDVHFTRVSVASSQAGNDATDNVIRSPMHGTIVEISVQEGDRVNTGQRLGVLEAMKMQHEIAASCDGEVRFIGAAGGDRISAGLVLFEIDRTADKEPSAE